MDLWQLKIFTKVIELKSFSKAGEAVHLTQPTVSSHIKELENHFETQLVDRMAKQAVPTKAGELLYQYAQRMLALYEETQTAMAEFLGEIKGRLCVGGSTIPGSYLLPYLIGIFKKTYPEVHIALIVADSSEILDKIMSGDIELGIVGTKSQSAHLQQAMLMTDDSFLVVPSDHKWAQRPSVSLREVIGESFIIRESGSGTLRALEESLHKQGLTLDQFHIVAEMGSTEAVRQGIKNGVGVSVLPAIAVRDDVSAGVLRTLPINGFDMKRRFYLTCHSNRTPSPLSRTFTAFLQSHFGQPANSGGTLCI